MIRSPFPYIFLCIFLIYMLVACGAPSTQAPTPETETPAPAASATDSETSTPTASFTETATLIPTPIEVGPLPTATPPRFATFCDPVADSTLMAAQCHRPIAEQSAAYCDKKIPYNLILMNGSASYELIGERFQCSDAGMKDGKKQVICKGPMGLGFELRVCDPACALPSYSSAITYCPEEYIFDSQRSCCTRQLQPADQNCVLLRLEAKMCSINCEKFTKKSTCEKNFYACEWYEEDKVCRPRNQK